MNHYIFNSLNKDYNGQCVNIVTIFIKDKEISISSLKSELGVFFQTNLLPDFFLFIGMDKAISDLKISLENDIHEILSNVPMNKSVSLDNICLVEFDKNRDFKIILSPDFFELNKVINNIINVGLQNIFILRGGMVEAADTHHYVFPSGKHCDRFLRTGNILVSASEIYFIAFSLLNSFKEDIHKNIYCDTSSINSLAFALVDLKSKCIGESIDVNISSFNSYSGLYDCQNIYTHSDLLLISASTSGNIVEYIINQHNTLNEDNIVILYFLNSKGNDIKSRILCNLTYDREGNPLGLHVYEIYKEGDCKLCKSGSYPVEVSGDVFLLEKPSINGRMITIKDPLSNLSSFVNTFKTKDKIDKNAILKVSYGENNGNNKIHEIYIDYSKVIDEIDKFESHKTKLNDYITQYIPANTKYIIYVDNYSSKKLAYYIHDYIEGNYVEGKKPILKSIDDIAYLENNLNSVVVVSSCVSNGKKLLYVARALRNLDKLRLVYFVGISRMKDDKSYEFLLSNLKQGKYKNETSTFVAIEKINCHNTKEMNTWESECESLTKFINYCEVKTGYDDVSQMFKKRIEVLINGKSDSKKGLSFDLFFDSHLNNENLKIRKNFAFFNFTNYHEQVSQADIYFTINNILNSKRNNTNIENSLSQSPFVRNLISPLNFNRFNDGIIQASILRSAYSEELCYLIDLQLSEEMYNILDTMIKYYKNDQAEGLIEFLYALAIKKLTLKEVHLEKLIVKLNEIKDVRLIEFFTEYIKEKTMDQLYNKSSALSQFGRPF